ncbi:MAG: nickel pincer cofactor biosynthesis protein LarB [Bacteroidales bacterium]|nr:nickel pincer cofactor biosynthesis protein LarB [Bacteroidales bacterium]MBN2820504.1 nickel pincer cofactor biosynthesis protein LarB [Bacteroidales bacterium]
MNEDGLRKLLEAVRNKETNIDEALQNLKDFEYKDLNFAKIDNHRTIRTGYPEVIFCQGKTPKQVAEIIKYMDSQSHNILGSRATPETFEEVKKICPNAEYNELARTIIVRKQEYIKTKTHIAILSAGTSDMPVAEEAAITAEIFNNDVKRYYDIGVAGIHRFYNHMSDIRKAKVLVVVAGMEGALPSIVGGVVDKPVIAVPTSVGYGAAFHGVAALLGMLTSCASGVSVVNIDNGFGAGYLAGMINNL